jgi:hypothetical protein
MNKPPAMPFTPRQVLLFSGHIVDAPERLVPRFPAAKVPAAAAAIERVLDDLGAGPADLALTQGAAGGDLLFVQACVARGLRVQLLLPLPEAEFIAQSIDCAGDGPAWRRLWFDLLPRLGTTPKRLADEPGLALPGDNVFERCNEWLMATALALGPDKLRLICLWDGGGGDGPGGTAHMVAEARAAAAPVIWIDTRTL